MRNHLSIVLLAICLTNVSSHAIHKRQVNPNFRGTQASSVNHHLHPEIQEQTITDAIQELALDISASQWDQGKGANMVQSPVSISALLSLILLAARGSSHTELKRALHYPNNLPDAIIHETYQKILGPINQIESGVNVTINTRLFLQDGLPILGTYTQVAQTLYNSQVRGLDFISDPSGSKDIVNQWVERTTYGKIKELIAQPFKTTTRFVAANTIYFNGGWEFPFSKPLTYKGTFNTGTKNISIPMMSNLITVPFLKGDQLGFDIISLPYKGGKYSMILMTPTGNAGLQSLIRVEYALDADVINQLISRMTMTKISVTIPRMKIKHKTYLKPDLINLGVTSIFDEKKADFGRLTTRTGIYLDDVVHEAVLEITENGTSASAATATSFDRIGGNEYYLFNKPSLLFIRDMTNNLTLFYARIVEPEPIL